MKYHMQERITLFPPSPGPKGSGGRNHRSLVAGASCGRLGFPYVTGETVAQAGYTRTRAYSAGRMSGYVYGHSRSRRRAQEKDDL